MLHRCENEYAAIAVAKALNPEKTQVGAQKKKMKPAKLRKSAIVIVVLNLTKASCADLRGEDGGVLATRRPHVAHRTCACAYTCTCHVHAHAHAHVHVQAHRTCAGT